MENRIVRKYPTGFFSKGIREKEEKELFKKGYRIVEDERIREFNPMLGCLLLILFFPLVFFAWEAKTKVVYEKKNNTNS